jgi:hypothetical protein
MSGVILINRDDPWIGASWVYSYIMERSLPYVPAQFGRLRNLMNEDENPLRRVVADELTEKEREVFFEALKRGYEDILNEDGKSFEDREFYSAFMNLYKELLGMIPPY